MNRSKFPKAISNRFLPNSNKAGRGFHINLPTKEIHEARVAKAQDKGGQALANKVKLKNVSFLKDSK